MKQYASYAMRVLPIIGALCVFTGLEVAVYSQDVTAEHLLEAALTNLDKIASGRGTLKVEVFGPYFGSDFERGRSKMGELCFSGDMARFDRTLEDGKLRVIDMFDGTRLMRAGPFSGSKAQIVVRTVDMKKESAYWGARLDLRGYAEPPTYSLQNLLEAVKLGYVESTISHESDGTSKLVHKEGPNDPAEFILWFDPSKGYAVVREQLYYKGKLEEEIQREFEDCGGIFVVKTCKMTRYVPESDKVDGILRMDMQDFQLNVAVDPKLFTLGGLGVDPASEVTDKDIGLHYVADPASAVEENVEALLSGQFVNSSPETGSVAISADKPESSESATSQPDKATEGSDFGESNWWVFAVVAAVAILVGLLFVRRKAK